MRKNQYFNIGYPESADFDYTNLERFLRFSINNCGDWGEYCNYLLNSFDFEKEVMEYFADLFKIPFEQSWGYVTNGGTEGNMFGCYRAVKSSLTVPCTIQKILTIPLRKSLNYCVSNLRLLNLCQTAKSTMTI